MTKRFVLTLINEATLKPEGYIFMMGSSFTVYTETVRRGATETEVTRVHDGHSNNGGWYVEGSLREVMDTIICNGGTEKP